MVGGARLRDLHCMWWLALLVLVSKALAGTERVGCYKKIPSTYNAPISQDHQSTGTCVETCRFKSLYFALYKGKYCSCGFDPPDSEQTTDSCDTPCAGIDSEICGGDNAYLVYRLTAGDAGDANQLESGGSSGNSGTSVSSKSSSSASTSSATAATAQTPATVTNSLTTIVGQGTTEHGPVVVTVTSRITESGQPKTVTTLESISGDALSASSSRHAGKKVKVGTVVGAAVGAFVGLVMALLLLIFILRRIAAKREQERMEKEYQEAIKPIDYDETLYMPKYAGNTSLQESKSSTVVNPFDDNRRVSNGSIVNETIEPNGNVLTVVNPDQ